MSPVYYRKKILEALLLVSPELYRFWLKRGRGRHNFSGAFRRIEPDASGRKRILLVDHDFPEPDRDAGSRAIACFASMLEEAGFHVVFWAATTTASARGRQALLERHIEAVGRADTGALEGWLRESAIRFEACVISRPLIAVMYMSVLKAEIRGPCVYYGHDIHHHRLKAQRVIRGGQGGLLDMWYMRFIERRIWRGADVVLYPSNEEADTVNSYLTQRGRRPAAEFFPLWTARMHQSSPDAMLARRRGILFVGSHAHAPNLDGLSWFLREVAPFVGEHVPSACLTIVGSGMDSYRPPEPPALRLRLLGHIDDHALDSEYAAARVVIAPLRYGAGVKGKVLEAISHGVPCVLTGAAAQGLPGVEASLPVTDDPLTYSKDLVHLFTNDEAWYLASRNAASWLGDVYSHERFIERLRDLI